MRKNIKVLLNYVVLSKGGKIMDFMEGKGPEQVISEYIEREMSEYKKVTEHELAITGVAPEAKQAFNRKPYYSVMGSFVKKPVIKL